MWMVWRAEWSRVSLEASSPSSARGLAYSPLNKWACCGRDVVRIRSRSQSKNCCLRVDFLSTKSRTCAPHWRSDGTSIRGLIIHFHSFIANVEIPISHHHYRYNGDTHNNVTALVVLVPMVPRSTMDPSFSSLFQCHWHIFGRRDFSKSVETIEFDGCLTHLSSAIYLNHSWLYVPWMNIPIMIIIYPCLVVHIPHELFRQNQTNHNLLNIPHVLYFWVCHHVLLFHIQTKKGTYFISNRYFLKCSKAPKQSKHVKAWHLPTLIKLDHMFHM